MSIEIEVKYRVASLEPLRERLLAAGAQAGAASTHVDTYFTHPSRDFASTDEALRIRVEPERATLTYKGPKHGGPTKTREEIEVPLAPGSSPAETLSALLDRLSFRQVAVIHKRRVPYQVEFQGRTMVVALDDAADLGPFAEVEAIAHDRADVAPAQQAVLALAGALGLSDVEPRSYLRMALERRGR